MIGNVFFYNGRNKVGNIVTYIRAGKMISRAYVARIRNPKTAAQVLQRAKFKLLSGLAKSLASALSLGFYGTADALVSARNVFIKKNTGIVGGEDPDDLSVGYDEMVVADGAGVAVTFGTPDFSSPSTVKVGWTNPFATVPGASDDDKVYVVVYCPGVGYSVVSEVGVRNGGGTPAEISIPAYMQGQRVHVYGFVVGSMTNYGYERVPSHSSYVGFGTIS